ncbi:MAG TPA: NTP transferase domain-containing protein, partial [Hyphomicrobium sp.]|nr:NTP transferase domain-containing protein [Hyphomicrobium sp.]
RGMSGSIAAGIASVGPEASASFIVPGDMAFLTPASVRSLIDVSRKETGASIVVPATRDGAQRNPVLWPRRYFGPLQTLAAEAGAKALLQAWTNECRMVAIDDGELADIDTEADLAAAQQYFDAKR